MTPIDYECYCIFNDGEIFPCSETDAAFIEKYSIEHCTTPLKRIYVVADESNPPNETYNNLPVVKKNELEAYIDGLMEKQTKEIAEKILPNW